MGSGGGRPIADTSTTDSLKSIFVGVKFLNLWLKSLEVRYVCSFQEYSDKMKELFKKTPNTIAVNTSQYFREKWQLLLTKFGGKCYM